MAAILACILCAVLIKLVVFKWIILTLYCMYNNNEYDS